MGWAREGAGGCRSIRGCSEPVPAASPRGIVSPGPLRLGDVALGGGCGLSPLGGRDGEQEGTPRACCAEPRGEGAQARPLWLPKPPLAPKAAPFHLRVGKSTEGAAPCPVLPQHGDTAGTPRAPGKGPDLPLQHRAHRTFRFTYFCFVYTACTEYTASDSYFPVELGVSPKMTSFINKYIYINRQ